MTRRSLRILAVVATGALGACSDGTGPEVELDAAEAASLAEAVMQAAILTTATGPGVAPAAVGGPLLAPFSAEVDVSLTADCPLGGTVDVDGEVRVSGDEETGLGSIELDVDHDHHGCMVESEDGVVFTFDGSPRLQLDLEIALNGDDGVGWSGTISGAVEFANDEREGRCTVALHFDGLVSAVEDEIAISVEGAVCRQAVDLSWSLALDLDAV